MSYPARTSRRCEAVPCESSTWGCWEPVPDTAYNTERPVTISEGTSRLVSRDTGPDRPRRVRGASAIAPGPRRRTLGDEQVGPRIAAALVAGRENAARRLVDRQKG